jgi:DNA-binding FadR family transcriptional regulator
VNQYQRREMRKLRAEYDAIVAALSDEDLRALPLEVLEYLAETGKGLGIKA